MKYFSILSLTFIFQVYATETANLNLSHDFAKRLIQETLKNSPKIKSLEAEIKKSEALKNYTLSQFLPQASFFAKNEDNLKKSSSSNYLTTLGIASYDKSYGLNYSMPIYNQLIINQYALQSSTYQYEKFVKSNQIKEEEIKIKKALVEVLSVNYKEKAVENSINRANTAFKEATLNFDLGKKTKVDVLRAEANLKTLQSEKMRILLEKLNATNNFKALSANSTLDFTPLEGLSESNLFELIFSISDIDHELKHFKENKRTSNSKLYEYELLNNLKIKEASSINSNSFPSLRIEGSWQNSQNEYSKLLKNPSTAHTIAIVFELPIGLGQNLYKNVETFYTKKVWENQRQEHLINANSALENQMLKVESLVDLRESYQKNIEQYEELYRLTETSYRLGRANLIELLEIQDSLLNTKIKYVETTLNLITELGNDKIITEKYE